MPQLKEYYHDVDLKANQLFNSRLHNITTAARTALGLGLTTNSKGYQVYDTDLSTPYFWDGVQWNAAGGGGGTWGSITGIITAQTDLTTYLSTNYYPLSSNPAGYLTSLALTPYLTSATAASTYVPLTRNLTINGTTYDLSADRTWTVSSPLAWLLAGNSGTTPGTDFIGTTDNVDLIFKTNNTEQLKITTGGIVQTPGVIRALNSTPVYVGAIDFTGNNGFSTIGWDSTNKGYLNLSNGLYKTYLRGTLITGSDKVHDLPNANGTLVMSVNGVYALSDGSVTIPTGSGTVTQVDTSAPLTGGPIANTGTIGITQATASTDGYLSSTDWNLFNSKLGTIPTLQQVVTAGNTTVDKTITVTATGSDTFVRLYDNQVMVWDTGVGNSQCFLESAGLTISNSNTGAYFNIDASTANPTMNANGKSFTFPNIGGRLPISVNGQIANTAGNITIPVGTGTVTSVGAGTGMNFTAITASGNVAIDTAKVPYYASAPSNGLLKYTSGTWGVDTNTYLTSVGTGTINELTYWSGANTLGSLTTGTYPSLTELSYVKGTTSTIQTQLAAKQDTITGAATTITSSDLTVSRALISNASGKVDISATTSTELGYVSGVTSGIQTQINALPNDWIITLGQQAMGSAVKSVGLGVPNLANVTSGASLTSSSMRLIAVYLAKAATLTGIKWMQTVIGNYTANNENRVGLYTYSAGVLTLVASSADDGNLWKTASSGTMGSKAFSSTYVASAGLYFIGLLWNSSSTVAAPQIGIGANLGAVVNTSDFTNSGRISCSITTTTLSSSVTLSATSATIANFGAWAY